MAIRHPGTPVTPLYCLDAFSPKAKDTSFYIEKFRQHLKTHAFISKPHKHDFYLLLYITSGGGIHTIDFNDYAIQPGNFFLMTPGQVHSWKLEPNTDGFIIFFLRNFYHLQLNPNSLVEFPFFHSLAADPLIRLGDTKVVDFITGRMYAEFNSTAGVMDVRILRSYLDLLLLTLARYYPVTKSAAVRHTPGFKLRKLEQLIEKNFQKLKRPNEYADLMHLAPSYLNNICKKNLGKTLSELIAERVLLEAKRFFAYSDMTVAEVSGSLNFSSPSYFIRFFKKATGQTPDQFKETLNRAI